MSAYIHVTLNHMSAVQRWAAESGAGALLDMADFTLEVKHRGRYYRMHPMFHAVVGGRFVHLTTLSPDVRGFGGWRPYQPITHPYSTDKQLFKRYLQEVGLRSPWWSDSAIGSPTCDYIVKARTGSFGRDIHGPFRAHTPLTRVTSDGGARAAFAEQFVEGGMLKIWYWGARPFFAHVQEYPRVVGTGVDTVEQLLRARVSSAQLSWDALDQLPVVKSCLAFQGVQLTDVLEKDREVWIDYRYGQLYPTKFGTTTDSDNRIEPLQKRTGGQLFDMGRALASLLRQTFPAPLIITVDGILDRDGNIWWLEMNTNSIMPPESYSVMFEDLFA